MGFRGDSIDFQRGTNQVSHSEFSRLRLGERRMTDFRAKTAWNDLTSGLADSFRGFFFRWLNHDITSLLGAKTAWNDLTSRLADSFRGFFFRWLRDDITSQLGAMPNLAQRLHGANVLTSRLADSLRGFFFRWCEDIRRPLGAKTAWSERPHKSIG